MNTLLVILWLGYAGEVKPHIECKLSRLSCFYSKRFFWGNSVPHCKLFLFEGTVLNMAFNVGYHETQAYNNFGFTEPQKNDKC